MARRLLIALACLLLPRLAAASCTGTDVYSVMLCAASPAHYWRMNTTSSGTDETDLNNGSYSQADATYVNTADVTVQTASLVPAGNSDKSVTFGGAAVSPGFALTNSSSQASFSPHQQASGGTGVWSLEFWFKQANQTGNQNLFSVADSSQYNWRLVSTSGPGSTLRFQIHSSAGTCTTLGGVLDVNSGSTVATATTYYVLLETTSHSSTWDSFAMYLNNALENSTTPSGTPCSSDHRFYFAIEGQDRNNPFAGVLDDVAIYDRQLTAAERADHYQGFPTNLLGPRRMIETKWRQGLPQAARLLAPPGPIYLDETAPLVARLNRQLKTAHSQYEGGG
jgi:Concanavalin A-like lectin/glucanases superfamily